MNWTKSSSARILTLVFAKAPAQTATSTLAAAPAIALETFALASHPLFRSGARFARRAMVVALALAACMAMAIPAGAQTQTVLWNFDSTTGAGPQAGLIQASDGNFYGTTSAGGANDLGTVFRVTPSGTVTVLHSFTYSGTDGNTPIAGVVQGTDGNFYGVAWEGGEYGKGTVFKISATGVFTALHAFSGLCGEGASDGWTPWGGLVEGTDGNFYGTSSQCTTGSSYGTLFKISSTGSFTPLYEFSGALGADPLASLVQGTDGNFYGTTNSGGASSNLAEGVDGDGTVFSLTPSDSYTLLHSFQGSDGTSPSAGLVEGANGDFYGTTAVGGANGFGTIFSQGSAFTLMHSFTGYDGSYVDAGLVQGSDGNFYGAASNGGDYNFGDVGAGPGTIFSISPQNVFKLLFMFGPYTIGAQPDGALVQGMDGSFYGTTFSGGTNNLGTIYKLTLSPALPPPVVLTVPSTVTMGESFTLTYSVANAYSATLQQCFATNTAGDNTGWTGVLTGSPTSTDVTLSAPSTPGTYTYTLTCGGMETGQTALEVLGPNAITWPRPASINYGTPLSSTQLDAATAVPGAFSYSPGLGTILKAGIQTLSVTFTPADPTHYSTETASVLLIVNKAPTVVSWSRAAEITYPTPLSATQLDATSTVPGTFYYYPAAGYVLPEGFETLSVTFIPTDTADYLSSAATVLQSVDFGPAPPVIWATPAPITYGTPLSATQLDATTTSSLPGAFGYSPSAGIVLKAGIQKLSVSYSPTNKNYFPGNASVYLTVNKAPTTVTWSTPAPISQGTPLSAAQLDATSTVPGAFYYYPAAGTVLPAGQNTLSVTFIPTDTADYLSTKTTVNLTVN